MKRIISVLGILAITACMAFGQTNWGKAVMYDSRTGRFLDPMVVTSNQLVVAGAQNSFSGTQTFYAITLGGVTQTNWPSGGGGSDPWIATHTGAVYGAGTSSGSIALGSNSVACTNSVVYGTGATGLYDSVSIGHQAYAGNAYMSMAVGYRARAIPYQAGGVEGPLAIGGQAVAMRGTAIGAGALATNTVAGIYAGALAIGAVSIANVWNK